MTISAITMAMDKARTLYEGEGPPLGLAPLHRSVSRNKA